MCGLGWKWSGAEETAASRTRSILLLVGTVVLPSASIGGLHHHLPLLLLMAITQHRLPSVSLRNNPSTYHLIDTSCTDRETELLRHIPQPRAGALRRPAILAHGRLRKKHTSGMFDNSVRRHIYCSHQQRRGRRKRSASSAANLVRC